MAIGGEGVGLGGVTGCISNVWAIKFRLTFVRTFSKMYYMCVVMSGISSAIFF